MKQTHRRVTGFLQPHTQCFGVPLFFPLRWQVGVPPPHVAALLFQTDWLYPTAGAAALVGRTLIKVQKGFSDLRKKPSLYPSMKLVSLSICGIIVGAWNERALLCCLMLTSSLLLYIFNTTFKSSRCLTPEVAYLVLLEALLMGSLLLHVPQETSILSNLLSLIIQ